jgi:anti-sigma regulatory factor (Ser/Thr protein kinase)
MGNLLLIPIQSELDIMAARSKTRDFARSVGMDTSDQARIAMATSSVAYDLKMGGLHEGHISIDHLHEDGRVGIRVTCTETGDPTPLMMHAAVQDARWMVDEVKVEQLPLQTVQITLIKWLLSMKRLSQ